MARASLSAIAILFACCSIISAIRATSRHQVASLGASPGGGGGGALALFKRSAGAADHHNNTHKHSDKHTSMVHSHLSRKVFDRACAASRDTIDEIIACLTGNELLNKTIKPDTAAKCYKDAFNMDFDPKDMVKHKELICNNRDKFENMTACIYRTTAESMDEKEFDKMTEAMVDVGLCIINALDG